MMMTDPEHGTREWSEDPVGDLMKMRQIIIDSFEKITESVKRFCEGLDDLTYTLLPPETPGWAIRSLMHGETVMARQCRPLPGITKAE